MSTIGITGANGQLGELVLRGLLAQSDPTDLVLVSRSTEQVAESAPTVPSDQIRAGDFADPDGLRAAFDGVDTLLLISIDIVGEERQRLQRNAVDAAKAAGVTRIVYTSVPGATPDNPALVAHDHADTEQAIRDSGLEWTFLRNNLYSDMQRPTVEQASDSGKLVTNIGDGATAYVTRGDCAAVAVAALLGDDHAGQAYDVTGPSAVDAEDLASIAEQIGGHPVEVVQVDDDAYADGLRQAGLPDELVEVLTTFGASTREGYLSNVSSTVEDLVGRAPSAFAEAVVGTPQDFDTTG